MKQIFNRILTLLMLCVLTGLSVSAASQFKGKILNHDGTGWNGRVYLCSTETFDSSALQGQSNVNDGEFEFGIRYMSMSAGTYYLLPYDSRTYSYLESFPIQVTQDLTQDSPCTDYGTFYLPAPPPTTLAGKVTETGGQALSGYTVKLDDYGTDRGSAVTDAEGAYSVTITGMSWSTSLNVIVTDPAGKDVYKGSTYVELEKGNSFDITVTPATVLDLTVTRKDGGSLTDLVVKFGWNESYTLDATGRFTRTYLAGESLPSSMDIDYVYPSEGESNLTQTETVYSQNLSLNQGENNSLAVDLDPIVRTSFSGVVKDGAGNPVQGANIYVQNNASNFWLNGMTDSEGKYSIATVKTVPATVDFEAYKYEYVTTKLEGYEVKAGQDNVNDFVIIPQTKMSGKVVLNGAPVTYTYVNLYSAYGNEIDRAYANYEGRYNITLQGTEVPVKATIVVNGETYEKEITVIPNTLNEIDLLFGEIIEPTVIKGNLRTTEGRIDSGLEWRVIIAELKNDGNQEWSVYEDKSTSDPFDEDFEINITNKINNAVLISVKVFTEDSPWGEVVHSEYYSPVPGKENKLKIIIDEEKEYATVFNGHVSDNWYEGPVEGAVVKILDRNMQEQASGVTDAEGNYSIEATSAWDPWQTTYVSVQADGYRENNVTLAGYLVDKDNEVENIVLVHNDGKTFFKGRVTRRGADPAVSVAGAVVDLMGGEKKIASCETDAEGNYAMTVDHDFTATPDVTLVASAKRHDTLVQAVEVTPGYGHKNDLALVKNTPDEYSLTVSVKVRYADSMQLVPCADAEVTVSENNEIIGNSKTGNDGTAVVTYGEPEGDKVTLKVSTRDELADTREIDAKPEDNVDIVLVAAGIVSVNNDGDVVISGGILTAEGAEAIDVFALNGQNVARCEGDTLDISRLEGGVYLVAVRKAAACATIKIVKQ